MRSKPLAAICPHCEWKNKFPVLMPGDIMDRKVFCSGCAKPFYVSVTWTPTVLSVKETGQ